MPRYRAKTLCFVDGAKRKPGDTFVTDAPHNVQAWELLDTPAPEAAKAAAKAVAKDEPKPKDEGDAFDKMDEEQARLFIDTREGKQPRKGASIEVVRQAARDAAGTDGVNT